MLKLSDLRPTPGSKKKRKRVGRGDGSGRGTYAGRGIKGQNARSGKGRMPGFAGGQTPLWKRLPKRGFRNPHRREYATVNLDTLSEKYEEGAEVTPEDLLQRGIVHELKAGVKVLARGELAAPLTVRAHRFSQGAREKIEAAGGQAIPLEGKPQAGPATEGDDEQTQED